MQKLHLVGFTTDHEGLILSARRGARSGGYVLALDDALEEAIDDLREQRAEDDEDEAARAPRIESTLPVREIQARLRQGRSIADVAKAAGVDAAWVERFAPPILAERARVIAKVRGSALRRARLGPSVRPVGDAVRHHVADRGVALTADEFDEAWSARQLADGRWAIRFTFLYRGRNQVLQFDLDESSGAVATTDRMSGQLGYVAPPAGAASKTRAGTSTRTASRPTAKRAVVSTGFRRDTFTSKPASRSAKERERAAMAMRKAAAQRAVDAERAASRRARERAAAARKKEREDKARADQAERDRRQRELATATKAKAAAVKKAAAQKAKAKATAAKKAAGKKQPVRKKAAGKKAAGKKAATTKQPVRKKAAVRKQPATTPRAAARRPHAPASAAPSARPRVAEVPAPTTAPRPRITAEPAPTLAPRPATSPVRAADAGSAVAALAEPAPRPQFRAGLVENAAEERAIQERLAARRALTAAASPAPLIDSSNGAESQPSRPPVDRPRRTRPLRAT